MKKVTAILSATSLKIAIGGVNVAAKMQQEVVTKTARCANEQERGC